MIVINANALFLYASLQKLKILGGFQEQEKKHSISTLLGIHIGFYSSTEDCNNPPGSIRVKRFTVWTASTALNPWELAMIRSYQ